ncbi:hypothetical protein IU444_08255 [Nocardia farcinica]|uniref:hypothetical protein n=1 Tax=Nocardia farcinica TaxID=37329 RepID=UPI001895BD40|nr:hypothetical protein [Nocardia farcinica]MBF6139909.1 hypothetical protein [Nocardia farcinica]MBF6384122.1 hypothetical protein [Nocardia farcinica]
MTGTLHTALMWLGAVVALVPVALTVRDGPPAPRILLAHTGMAACMALLAVGAGSGWAELGAAALAAGCALLATPACRSEPGAAHCVIDLLAMTWLVLAAAPAAAGAADLAGGGHRHGGGAGNATVLDALPLVIWVGAAYLAARSTAHPGLGRRRVRIGFLASLAMAATMTPMVL